MTEAQLSTKIDELINQLKKDLLNVPYNSRGVWDRVKNWWHNLTKTPNNPSNPYYFTNKFGALGRTNSSPPVVEPEKTEKPDSEEVEIPSEDEFRLGTSKSENRITLKDYSVLKECAKKLEEQVCLINEGLTDNLKNLEMFRIIDSWAINFKKQIMQLLKGEISENPAEEETKDETPKAKPVGGDGGVLFKIWIRDVDNIHYFIELVNHIFSNPVRYKKPLMNIAEVLKKKGVLSPKKGDEGTPLGLSIRMEILRMIKKEVEINTKMEDSILKPAVWSWARNLPSWGREKKEKKTEFEEMPPTEEPAEPVEPSSADDGGTEEFLNI